jgi:hypothetical protein
MTAFPSIEEAFKWWIANIYKSLPPERKQGRLKSAWRDYTYKKGISEARMKEILSEFGKIDIKTVVTFIPD